MFSKMNKIIKFSLLGALGFGIGGAVFGYIQTNEDGWFWILGLAFIGLIGGATIGFILDGRKKASNFAIFGTIAGVVGGYITNNSDFEPWLKMAIIGLVFGVMFGAVIATWEKGKGKSDDRELRCDKCNGKVGKKDKFCPNCGVEFE
jgi:uncharacterized membrane protein YeaQ/YmgE (transglycosylase-associated protein family)